MIPLYKVPIPFINVLQPRPLDDNFQTNCLAGMNPMRHKPWEMFNPTHPLFKEHAKLNTLGDLDKFEEFYNRHLIYGSGDRHPNMKFTWAPPRDEISINLIRNPESDPALLWERSASKNEFFCRCGLRGDVFAFTKYVLADQSKRKPCEKLNEVSQERAVAYLTGIVENSIRFKQYKHLIPGEVSMFPSGYQYSGYFHIARYAGCLNAWASPLLCEWIFKHWNIRADTLRKLDIGYVEDLNAISKSVLTHPRFNDKSLLISSGLMDGYGKPAFLTGSLVFPYKVDGTVIHLSGYKLPIQSDASPLSAANLFVKGVAPLFNEADVTDSTGIRPIYLCDSLLNVLILAERGQAATGVPFWSDLHMAHVEPFRKLQRIHGRNHKIKIIIAFSQFAQVKPQTLGFIWRLQELGFLVSRLDLPKEFKHLLQFHKERPAGANIEDYLVPYETNALTVREGVRS